MSGAISTQSPAGGGGRGRRRRGVVSQDFELNLASIIDCFVVLIAFVLVSTSFVSIGIINTTVEAAAPEAAEAETPPVRLVVELKADRSLALEVTGKETRKAVLPAKSDGRDYTALEQQLAAVKAKWPTVAAVTLTPDSAVEHREVVKTMESIRKSHPNVLLGGF